MKRLILPLLGLAAMVYATMSMLRHQPAQLKSDPPSPPPASSFSHTIAAVGIVEPNSEAAAIGTPLAGVVEKIFVKVGAEVKQGDPLFELDVRHLHAELGVRKATLETARAKMQTVETQCSDVADQLDRAQKLAGTANVISADELMRRKYARQVAEARLGEARAEVASAESGVRATETELERSIVRAPMDAEVIQLKVRVGEFAPAGQTAQPLLVIGKLHPMHVRVDVDEHEGWRVRAAAGATAHVRGNADLQTPLKFVQLEPMVVPKRALSGDSTERVDTRVLQVIYEVADPALQLFVGQQMDVFIDDMVAREKPLARTASAFVPPPDARPAPRLAEVPF